MSVLTHAVFTASDNVLHNFEGDSTRQAFEINFASIVRAESERGGQNRAKSDTKHKPKTTKRKEEKMYIYISMIFSRDHLICK